MNFKTIVCCHIFLVMSYFLSNVELKSRLESSELQNKRLKEVISLTVFNHSKNASSGIHKSPSALSHLNDDKVRKKKKSKIAHNSRGEA